MSTSIEPLAPGSETSEPENLGLLHLAVERKHDRSSALRWRVGAAWQDTPDWRFHRHAMRIGLYLRERAQLTAGDRLALVCSLRPEWATTQWGALAQGVATAVIDPALPDPELAAQLAALGPRAVFVEGAAVDRVIACLATTRSTSTVVVLDGDASGGLAFTWSEALDLGGSLDTAERANSFRAQARAVPQDTPALAQAWPPGATTGSVGWRFLSHREVVRRVQRVWLRARIARGDVAYVAGGAPSLATSVALLAFTADGYTQVVLGSEGNELEEIAMTRAHKIIAPVETARPLVESLSARDPSRLRDLHAWLSRVRSLPGVLQARATRRVDGQSGSGDEGSREERRDGATPTVAGRARWLSTGASLPLAARAQARRFLTLEIDDSLALDHQPIGQTGKRGSS
jgi:hypothetical protein